ncbi:MAG: hypothetical protein M3Q85_12405 [Acidobacteriota bacterium]|nr:hypothetical protein [Acidobacteriota bacterium]
MNENELAGTIIALIVLAGVGLMVAAMMNRRRFRELEHRERLAMIERGVVPSPESDPAAFEARIGAAAHDTGTRYRTAGVLMIGLGLGLLVLLTFAAHEPMVGIGVGGGWAVLGAASLYDYFLNFQAGTVDIGITLDVTAPTGRVRAAFSGLIGIEPGRAFRAVQRRCLRRLADFDGIEVASIKASGGRERPGEPLRYSNWSIRPTNTTCHTVAGRVKRHSLPRHVPEFLSGLRRLSALRPARP